MKILVEMAVIQEAGNWFSFFEWCLFLTQTSTQGWLLRTLAFCYRKTFKKCERALVTTLNNAHTYTHTHARAWLCAQEHFTNIRDTIVLSITLTFRETPLVIKRNRKKIRACIFISNGKKNQNTNSTQRI